MTFDIVHSVNIRGTPKRVFSAITTKSGVSRWWVKDNSAQPTLGAIQYFKFGKHTRLEFRVEEIEPHQHVVWKAISVPDEWEGTSVTFDLDVAGREVELFFRHSGFQSQDGIYGMTSYSWAQYIRSLKLLIEKGRGEVFGSRGSIACGTTPR